MSALTSKADISRRHLNVRFVPIADICTESATGLQQSLRQGLGCLQKGRSMRFSLRPFQCDCT